MDLLECLKHNQGQFAVMAALWSYRIVFKNNLILLRLMTENTYATKHLGKTIILLSATSLPQAQCASFFRNKRLIELDAVAIRMLVKKQKTKQKFNLSQQDKSHWPKHDNTVTYTVFHVSCCHQRQQ